MDFLKRNGYYRHLIVYKKPDAFKTLSPRILNINDCLTSCRRREIS